MDSYRFSLLFLNLDLSGRYLRKYEIINGDCQILEDNNKVDNKISLTLKKISTGQFSKFSGRIMKS